MCPKAEKCSKCRRDIAGEEQAYVFEDEIVCKHCNTKLRNIKPWWRTFGLVISLIFVVVCACVLSWFLWTRFSNSAPEFIVQIRKTALGSAGPRDEVLLSPDGRRIAISKPNQAWTSEVNAEGRPVPVHRPSEDGKTSVLVLDNVEIGETGGTHLYPAGFKFSPDSQRFMYENKHGKGAYVVVDGTKGKEYLAVRELTFSLDSKHFAYCARMKTSGDYVWTVITDGIEGPTYSNIGGLTFNNDGTKLAYRIINNRKMAAMVVNGERGELYSSVSAPAFFINNRDVVYIGTYFDGETDVVVVGETEGHPYEAVFTDSLKIDPTGTRYAYAADRGDKLIMVVDGKESWGYDEVSSPLFSSDGQRLAYRAKSRGRDVVVLDGVESKKYDEVRSGLFSPDSRRFGFVARRGDRWLTVIDGVEGSEYETVLNLLFSPNSKRIAYIAGRNDKFFVIVDGVEGEECDLVLGMMFSPDSTRFAYEMNLGRQPYPELTEDEQYTNYSIMPNGKRMGIPLPNEKGAERLRQAEGRWHFVLDGAHGKEYESVFCPTFSTDSKHFVYWASDGDRLMTIVDDVCVFEGEDITLSNISYAREKHFWHVTPEPLRNRFIFDSPVTFHTFAKYGGEVVRLDFTILDTKK